MTLYVVSCKDKPGSLDLRLSVREAHLAYMKSLGDLVKLGGPYLDDQDQMAGSLIIVEAQSLEDARAISDKDPYKLAGLFASVEITPFRATMKNLG